MRKILAVIFLYSAGVWACPELAGTFKCTYQNGSYEYFTITQTIRDSFTVYNINGSDITADNQTYSMPDDNNLKSGKFRAWCDDRVSLKGVLTGVYVNDGQVFGDLTLNVRYFLANGHFKQVTSGVIKTKDKSEPFENESICQRSF